MVRTSVRGAPRAGARDSLPIGNATRPADFRCPQDGAEHWNRHRLCLLPRGSGDYSCVPRLLSLAVRALLAVPLVGCAGAKPYERALLAQPKMQLVPDPNAVLLEQHVYEYREGASGGYGGGGGGCGCN